MGMGNLLVLAQITGYVFAVILSLFIFPPIAVSQQHFDKHCILFSSGVMNNESLYEINDWSSGSQCGFAIFVGIVIFLVSLWQTIRLSIHAINDTDSSFLMTFVTMMINLLVNIMILASAITVTQGYKAWCSNLSKNSRETCEFAGYVESFWADKNIEPEGFNIDWGIAQFGLWSVLIVYVILACFSFAKILKLHKQENILRSLSRERQRLLGHYEQPDI